MSSSDVIIAGGGIIGLSIALELAERGLRVTVLERGTAMSEASWAAAGMLAARDPENPSELQPLSDLSISLYPDYLRRVQQFSGVQVPLRTHGTLQGSAPGHRFATEMFAEQLAQRLPELTVGNRHFLWLDEDSLDPRDLCRALPLAAAAKGVTLVENTPVSDVRSTISSVEVTTAQSRYSAAHFVNCGGAWAGQIAAAANVAPRKGQMVVVKLPDTIQLPWVIRMPELYLVPRGDGRIVIGATVEQAGFDKSVQEESIQSLLEAAAALWPPVREGKVIESWAGLRPGSADGLPILGACGDPHQWLATGHFRNGILLAPATARVMRQLILGEKPSVNLTAFRCDRFATQPSYKQDLQADLLLPDVSHNAKNEFPVDEAHPK